ncbi:N-acetylneuraminic acid mutarotase [Paracoccus alkenifer]|uniref:N-acetylneuraminic acid mutarotase n=2 Tax=Paracoccus alkenifer TaxID=65735 RepID=A0A1H6LNE4_9RHOB|nr:N-acetylneuraminic acid mutarotase [Paracoccus alkenifer]
MAKLHPMASRIRRTGMVHKPWAIDQFRRKLDWTACALMPAPRNQCAAATSGGRVYVFGGEYLNEVMEGHEFTLPHKDVLAYDHDADSWSVVTQMPTPRKFCHAITAPDGRIHVIGGLERKPYEWVNSTVIETYVPSTGKWINHGFAPLHMLGAAAGTRDGKIYMLGGFSSDGSYVRSADVSQIEIIGSSASFPRVIAPMPTARVDLAAIEGADGRIYAVGGVVDPGTRSDVVEAYDPKTKSWKVLAPMPTARSNATLAAAADGRIIAMGGMGKCGFTLDTVEAYTPATNSWKTLPSCHCPRMYHASAVTADGRIMMIGGQCKPCCDSERTFLPTAIISKEKIT